MIGFLSVTSLAGGTLAACLADRLSSTTKRAELLGGVLLIVGFALIGVTLAPLYR